jgi:hypothetical protein
LVSLFTKESDRGELREQEKLGSSGACKETGEVPYVYSICYNNNNNNNDDDNDNVIRIEHTLGAAPTRFIDCFQ